MAEYQHRPDQSPMGDKNFLLYMLMAFLLVMLFSQLMFKTPAPSSQPPSPPAAQNQSQNATAPVPPETKRTPEAATPIKQAPSEAETVVENDLYKITFSNRGALAKSWILKKYKDDKGNPLELINRPAAERMGLPLSLWTYDESLRKKLNDALYVGGIDANASSRGAQSLSVRKDAPPLLHLDAAQTLTFEYADQDMTVRKTFHFDHSYVVRIETSVTRDEHPVQAYPAWPSALGDQVTPATYATSRLNWQTPEGIQRQAPFEKNWIRNNTWVVGGGTIPGPFFWAGVADQYFAAVFMPSSPQSAAMVTLHETMEVPKDPNDPKSEKDTVHLLGLAVGNPSGTTEAKLFVGPKALDVLTSVKVPEANTNLEGVIDFGTFGFFAKLLFRWLNWTHDHLVSNWGWSIVMLTFIINLIFLPLRLKQMKVSLTMQKVQPQIQAINKKYEKYGFRDQEKQQQKQKEIMEVYHSVGMNPYNLSGCLPLLLQLPILYAFYAMLSNTVELRHAAWLWIRDLTAPDPWHLLPLLTIASMVLVQRATPQPGMDPTQRRMMNIMMPLMFGFMTWAVASGLALYWATSNIISIAQQWAMNQTKLGREIRELQLKRLRKKNK